MFASSDLKLKEGVREREREEGGRERSREGEREEELFCKTLRIHEDTFSITHRFFVFLLNVF